MVPTRNPEQTTIFDRNNDSIQSCAKKAGFTLIEILIVLGIISMVMALALPAIERVTRQRVVSTCRQFIGTIRTIRNDAVLLNQVHRLGFDFDKKEWWVDNQREFKLLDTEASLHEKSKKKKPAEPPPSNFSLSEKYSKKPIPFPDGVSIDGVLKEREGFRKEGIIVIHFFPNGYNEQAILYINRTGQDLTDSFSLHVLPTSGKVDFFKRFLKDFEAVNL